MKSRIRPIKPKPAGKKHYRTPQLSVFGTLRHLTKVKGGMMNDGSGKPMTKSGGMNA
jgi:hypothetical protein